MQTSLLRGRRYSVFSGKLLLAGVFFISFFGAIGFFSLDTPARANSLAVPATILPQDGAVINGKSYPQTWSAVAGAVKYEYQSYHDALGAKFKYGETLKTPMKPNANTADGTIYWWRVRAVDNMNAVGPWSPLSKITIDNVAPTTALTTSSPSGAPNLYNGPITITGTVGAAEKNFASHTFTVTNPQGVVSTIGPISTVSLTHSFTLDTSARDGQYTIVYSALDKAGNKSAAIAPRVVVVDNTAPDAPVLSGDAARIMQPGDVVHSWAPSTATDVNNYIFKAFSSEADAAAPDTAAAIATETLAANQKSVTRATGTTDGTYWYRVAAVDNAGNKTWGDQVFSVTVDNTPPATPTIAIEDFVAGGVTNQTAHTVNWQTTSTDAVRYVFRYGIEGSALTEVPTIAAQWQGIFGAGDGTYVVQVQAIDGVGNESEWSALVKLRIDSAAPGISLTELSSTVAPASVVLTGTVDDDTITSVTVLLDGAVHGTAPVSNGVFSYPFNNLSAKAYTIGVTAKDEAGNEGVASTSLTVTEPPVVTNPPVTPSQPAAPVANTPVPAGRTAVVTPATNSVPADDTEGEVFEPVAAQDRSAIESEATEAGQETKGVTDSRVVGDSSLMMWLGWIIAFVLAMGWFWWMVAGRRRRREDE